MKEFIDYISGRLSIQNKSLLEKDILLHKLLVELNNHKFFDEFIFKGGTCLTKCYLGYYRFSEDLDFTYTAQKEFNEKSQKEIRRILSKKITEIIIRLSDVCKVLNLSFNPDKSDKKYIELGGSNKFATFKLWYKSAIMPNEQFIKIQINFAEKLFYKPIIREAKTIITGITRKEIELLYPEQKSMLETISVPCYDIKEIMLEKVRAIITRRQIKSRDFIDLYILTKKEKIRIENFEKQIIEKISFMLQYDKYTQNLSTFNIEKLILGEEKKLLLQPVGIGFEKYLKETIPYIKKLSEKLKKERIFIDTNAFHTR